MVFEGLKAGKASEKLGHVDYGIRKAYNEVTEILRNRARMVSTTEELAQIATRAVKGDKKIGELVAKAVQSVGNEAAFVIPNSEPSNNQIEFVNGMMVDRFFVERYCNLVKKGSAHVFENPFILIHEDKESIKNVLKDAIDQAEDAPIIAIGGLSEIDKPLLQDLAILTGGQVLTKELDTNFTSQMFGSCKEVAKTNEGIAILGGSGGREKIEEQCEQLRFKIKTISHRTHPIKLILKMRLANLSNGATVLKFVSELDKVQQKKDLVDKALSVAKAVAEFGIVDDVGVALLHASKELDKLETKRSSDEKLGVQAVQNALKMPVYVAAAAAGFNGSFVVQKLLEQDNPNLGYDLTNGEFLNVTEYGIANPINFFMSDFYESMSFAIDKLDFECLGLSSDDEKYLDEYDRYRYSRDKFSFEYNGFSDDDELGFEYKLYNGFSDDDE